MLTKNDTMIDQEILERKKALVSCFANRFDIFTLCSEFKANIQIKELVKLYKIKFG